MVFILMASVMVDIAGNASGTAAMATITATPSTGSPIKKATKDAPMRRYGVRRVPLRGGGDISSFGVSYLSVHVGVVAFSAPGDVFDFGLGLGLRPVRTEL